MDVVTLVDMERWKDWQWETVTTTMQVYKGSCFLGCFSICSDGNGIADGKLYDGFNTSGRLITALAAKDDDMENGNLHVPMYLRQGLHVVVGSNVGSIMVHYMPDLSHPKAALREALKESA